MIENVMAFLKSEASEHDQACRPLPIASGLLIGTRIATTLGWRAVEALTPGERVLTFDAGLQRIAHVARIKLWEQSEGCPGGLRPLLLPAGVIGNRSEIQVLPGQGVMIESDVAEELYGDPFALIPAQAVDDLPGLGRSEPQGGVEAIVLQFETPQVLFAEAGALLFCPGAQGAGAQSGAAMAHACKKYNTLPLEEARRLMRYMRDECARGLPAISTADAWSAAVLSFARGTLERDPVTEFNAPAAKALI
ncbi:MAG: Hint domain-containing protein [Pseudomonadota bacterium]